MEEGLECLYVFDLTIVVLLWMEHDGVHNLLSPGDFLFTVHSFKELLDCFSLLFGLSVCNNFDNNSVLLRNFNDTWL